MSQRKLLLADDSITIQKVVNLTFADEGIEVITVGDGDSAMEKMTEIVPDLVLADINMPGLNGYEVCEKIRQSDALKNIPVILLVGSFEPFDEEEARRVGANDFLTKPFQSIRQLVNKVNELLDISAQKGAGTNSQEAANTSAAGSFADTQEYVAPADYSMPASAQSSAQQATAGMDDDMIQTSSASGFALDESAKFETREVAEPEFDARTQPLSAADLQEFSFDHAAEEKSEGFQETARSSETVEEEEDLLELPFDPEEEYSEVAEDTETSVLESTETESHGEQIEAVPVPIAEAETSEADQTPNFDEINTIRDFTVTNDSVTDNSAAAVDSAQFSPEMIDAVAQRVIEKLSDAAIREIAWEVVPQMAELIIKKMAEEKLKQ